MRRWFLFFTTFCFVGALYLSASSQDDSVLLGETPDPEKMESFKKVIASTPGTDAYEKARVDYLLERLRSSPYNFIRNDEMHTKAEAVSHLKWKYRKHYQDAPTAEAFVDNIASNSKSSGRPYLVKTREGKIYPSRVVFHHELDLLSAAEHKFRGNTAGRRVST